MTLLQSMLGRSPTPMGGPRASLQNPQIPISGASIVEYFGGWAKTFTGKRVTEESAVTSSAAVWQAVNLIADTCAGLPMHAYRRSGTGSRAPLDPLSNNGAKLLADPHPDLTPFELWGLGYGSLCLYGNAYYRKLKNGGGVIAELWWINPSRVRVGRDSDTGAKYYILDGDEEHPYSDDTILHIPGFGYDGVCGVSPIRAARQGIALGLAAEEFAGNLYANGSLATGILQTDQRIDEDESKRLKKLWKLSGTGMDSAHDIKVMGSGAKFQQLTINPEDAQFLETREFQITEIARWFGLPPHMLMQTDKATSWGTGIETQNQAMITYTFSRYTTRLEQRLTKHVLSPGPVYAKVSYAGLLRGDTAARGAWYRTMRELGAFNANDIRALEDLDPVKGGDVYYVPMNMMVMGEKPAEPAVPPAPADPAGSDPAQESELSNA